VRNSDEAGFVLPGRDLVGGFLDLVVGEELRIARDLHSSIRRVCQG